MRGFCEGGRHLHFVPIADIAEKLLPGGAS